MMAEHPVTTVRRLLTEQAPTRLRWRQTGPDSWEAQGGKYEIERTFPTLAPGRGSPRYTLFVDGEDSGKFGPTLQYAKTAAEWIDTGTESTVEATDDEPFDPDAFFGRWFLSRKQAIPQAWIDHVAERYPYRGKAYRLDNRGKLNTAPLASWSRSVDGIRAWISHSQRGGLRPLSMEVSMATITGFDLAAFVQDHPDIASDRAGKLVIEVEEVVPTRRVTGAKVVT